MSSADTFETLACEQCGDMACVLDRFLLPSTDGPVEHLRTHCVNNHYLTVRAVVRGTVAGRRGEPTSAHH